MRKKVFFLLSLFIIICLGCSRKKTPIISKPFVKPNLQPINITSLPEKEVVKYIYEGLSFRDPFIPLSGEKMAKAKLGLTKDAIVPSLGGLQLKGITFDKKDNIAIFSSPFGSYIFVNGKLYDSQNRLVKGITGKMTFDNAMLPTGVVLISEDNYLKEYKLPEKIK